MIKNYTQYFKPGLKSRIFTALAVILSFAAGAQTIDVNPAEPDRPEPALTYFTGTDDAITFTTTGSFETGTTFYLHTGSLEEDNVLAQASAASTLTFTWPQSTFGNENLFITAATGSFTAESIEIDQNMVSVVGGTIDNFGDFVGFQDYDMRGTGVRRVTTQAVNVDFTDEVVLNINLYDNSVVADRPLRVQFSTDGVNFTNMTDTNSDDEWFGVGTRNLQFVLTSGQKTSGTIFRIVQENSNSLTSFQEAWYLDEEITLEVGGIVTEVSQFVANYNISAPSTAINSFNDASGNTVFNYYAGQTVEVAGSFFGATDQEDDFSYTAVFEDGNDRFQLQSVTDATVGTDITVEGTIPADIEFNQNWTVTIEAYNGTAPILGLDQEFSSGMGNLNELTAEGGSLGAVWEFTADEDRSLTTPAFNIESNDNSYVSFDLSKISSGLSPDGTEIVLEYSTGSGYTQIGDAVSLNDDLSEAVVFDALPAGIVSNSTMFRIRQLSNNGAGLSTWSVNNIEIVSGGNLITNGDVEYFGSNITVFDPNIVLDPANVPDDLIYPGSELTLTYNITDGALSSGSTITAILNNGSFDFIVGTSSAITPGDAQDHTITITIPSVVGNDYSVKLVSTDGVESNSIVVPVFNTTLEITDIASNSGVTDGGQDVIFPGSEITVTYTIDGQIGAGSELMLEVRDYDQDVEDNDGYAMISTSTTIDGTITGTLPTDIDFDDNGSENPTIRVKIGNGVLAQTGSEFVLDEEGNSIFFANYRESVFDFDLTQGNNTQDTDVFIGSGTRSATTFAYDFSLGGLVNLSLVNFGSYNNDPQTVSLQASLDGGTTWTTFATDDYVGGNIFFSETIPQDLRGDATRLRFIYNEDGAAAEFENQLRLNYITLSKSATTQANSDTETFNAQFRKPTVSLEQLSDYDFTVGEELTIEYTTSGPFPANTAFAIVLSGNDIETVIGESDAQGLASVDVVMPDFAFEDNGDGAALYDEIKVVAFDKTTPTTSYTPDETIIIDEDEQFLVIEGTDETNGFYVFDEAGDRSLLTQAFDLSGADKVSVNFNFVDFEIDVTDNLATIPVLQVSVDGGATFQNIPAEEDGILGDGYLFNTTFYRGEVPSEFITDATHFRWYQPLNLGASRNVFYVYNISLTLEKGNEISTFYGVENSPVAATLSHPNINDFEWDQVNEDTDAVFNGETFSYEWTKTFESTPGFPESTIFEFLISDGGDFVIDPATNRPYVIGATTSLGTFEAEIPFFVEEGNYDIHLIAKVEDAEEGDYFYFGEDDGTSSTIVGDLDVFLRAVKTTLLGDPNATIYAGSTVTFSIDIENDDDNMTNTDDLFANLIVEYAGDDWIIATQQGTADITVDLPPFVSGSLDFRVELSENGPLGDVGDILDDDDLMNIEDDLDNFINERQYTFINTNGTNTLDDDFFTGNLVQFQSVTGRRFLTTRTFAVGELEDVTLLEFEILFNQLPENLTADQYVVFEYSTDGGTTFNEIRSFPETDADQTLNFDNIIVEVTDDMKNNPVRFRWRQQENKGILNLNNISFISGERLPFDNIETRESISRQAILITGISANEICKEGTFDISYEIRGRFGADNLIEIRYQYDNGSFITSSILNPYEFSGITEGSGTLTGIKFPGDFLDEGDNNAEVYLQLEADDDTNDDFNFFVRGTFAEEFVELVAPIDLDASFFVPAQKSCDLVNIEATIFDVQNYFTYTLRNAADGTELGSLTYDPEDGENTIDLGMLSEDMVVEMLITSRSSNGLECNTIVSTNTRDFEVLQDFELYRLDASNRNILVQPGESSNICSGQANTVRLVIRRDFGDGSFGSISTNNVEWFRNDLNNPIANPGSVLGDGSSELLRSGNYFARITDGDCVYLTESYEINVVEQPAKPVVTVVSGDLAGCEGVAEDVVLQAPEGFQFYDWSNGATTREITVSDAGSYTVSVSNQTFNNGGCSSVDSDPIVIERSDLPVIELSTTTNLTTGKIGAGSIVRGCESARVYFYEDGSRSVTNGTLVIRRDGEIVGTTTSSTINLEVSGSYTISYVNDDINANCEASSVEFTVEISEQPTEVPVLTATGATDFCDGAGEVVLTAPAGFTQYRWYRNGGVITSNTTGFDATSNTYVVRQDGTYTVQVGNAAGCYGPLSNAIELNVRSLPAIPTNLTQAEATCGNGPVTFSFSGNNLYSYQLINAETGEASGNAVIGNDGTTLITSGDIETTTDFFLEVSYADGSGCVNSDLTREVIGSPNNVVLEASGATLTAVVSRWGSTPLREIRWYRNGVLIRNRTNDNSIVVLDNAEYSVEVEFEGDGLCIITSNSIDLGTGEAGEDGDTQGRIEARTYPNPAKGGNVNVDIDGNNFGKYTVNIMTLTGQVMISEEVDKQSAEFSAQLDISKLDRGIYNMQVIKGNEFKNIRIVIQ